MSMYSHMYSMPPNITNFGYYSIQMTYIVYEVKKKNPQAIFIELQQAMCGNHPPRWPLVILCLLAFDPSCGPLPHWIKAGLYDQLNVAQVMVCYFSGYVIKYIFTSAFLLLHSFALEEARYYVMRIYHPRGDPKGWGPSANSHMDESS